MPTPFYHLSLAEEIIAHPDLPDQIRALLTENRCAFFLGKTAPDVQSISGQARHETHFFTVPPKDSTPPWVRFLNQHPDLTDPSQLPPDQAVFLAGYLCHLQADFAWIDQIFLSKFSKDVWPDRRSRYYMHNALRAYLDEKILADLPDRVGASLATAQPDHWLPFVEDGNLCEWRDFLAEQLAPGAQIQTAKIFAIRMNVDVDEFAALIASEERLESELFDHISRQTLVKYRRHVIKENLELLTSYLFKDSRL